MIVNLLASMIYIDRGCFFKLVKAQKSWAFLKKALYSWWVMSLQNNLKTAYWTDKFLKEVR